VPFASTVLVVDKPQGLHWRTKVCSYGAWLSTVASRIGRSHTGQRKSPSLGFIPAA
jgi:hypothetical protein